MTQFRSVLGGLLWLCSARLDIIADVGILQSAVSSAEVRHLRLANQLVLKACSKDKLELGLRYRFFPPKTPLRLQCIHDASSASKGRTYAQEGVVIALTHELPHNILHQDDLECDDHTVHQLSGYGHSLYAHGGKAKRVSYSTSHAETLSAVNALESSSMVSTRLTELWLPDAQPSLKTLTHYQENGSDLFPADFSTDCKGYWELCAGAKAVPQDKQQRLYVLAIKEARVTGRIRYMILTPTEYMLADPLTKPMLSPMMMKALSSGYIEFGNVANHPMVLRRLPHLAEVNENDLYKSDEQIKKEVNEGKKTLWSIAPIGVTSKRALGLMLMFSIVQAAAAQPEQPTETEGFDWFLMAMMFCGYAALRFLEYLLSLCFRSKPKGKKKKVKNDSGSESEEVDHSSSAASSTFLPRPKEGPMVRNRTLNLESPRSEQGIPLLPEHIHTGTTGECYHRTTRCGNLGAGVMTRRRCKKCTDRARNRSGV